jgi:hypothetical protein
MYIDVNSSDFQDAFVKMGRENNFTYEAREALFNYYETLEEDTGEQMELDVIAICCDWTEYDNDELINDYDYMLEREEDEDETEYIDRLIEHLEKRTHIIKLDNGYILQAF